MNMEHYKEMDMNGEVARKMRAFAKFVAASPQGLEAGITERQAYQRLKRKYKEAVRAGQHHSS